MAGAVYDDGAHTLLVMNPADMLRHVAAKLTALAAEIEAGTMVVCECTVSPMVSEMSGHITVDMGLHYKPVTPPGATLN